MSLTEKITKYNKLNKKETQQFKNIEEQTWDVIYSYFKTFPKWMARHQLDSYNDFIHNNIPRIFKQKGYYRVLSYRGEYAHIFDIYIGGKNHNKFRISHPTIYDHHSGKSRPLYPNEARLKNITYGFDLFYDVEVVLNVYQGENNEINIIKDYTFPDAEYLKNVYLGNIPIMLHSDICVLNKIPKASLELYGENPEEPGGYIILDGSEKVLLCQQRKAENTLFIKKITGIESDRYKHQCVIKSKLDEAFQPGRDNCLYIENNGEISMRIGPIGKEFIRPITAPEHQGFRNKYIPIFVLFRYLGIESDKDIMEMICGDLDSQVGKRLAFELIPCIQDKVIMTYNIYDKQGADSLLAPLERTRTQLSGGRELKDISRNKVQRLAYLQQTMRQTFLPHCGTDDKAKAFYLAYMIRRLLLNYLEIDQDGDTSLDSYINKRIDTGGILLSSLFRTAFIEGILYNIRRQLDTILELNPDMRGPDAINVINENTYRTIFSVDSFNKYFTSKLKIGLFGNKAGVLQQLDRTNYLGTISHIRRMNDPTFGADKSMVAEDKRKVHSTHFGFICPNESNDGGNIGLRVALALLASISVGYPIKQIKQWCFSQGVETLTSMNIMNTHNMTKVFINGTWIGCINNPLEFVRTFKLHRRNSLINSATSISFYTLDNEIKIWCDDGRVIRPVYIVENNELLITDTDFNAVYNGNMDFNSLCSSKLLKNKTLENNSTIQWNLMDTNVYNLSRLNFNSKDSDLKQKLIDNQCLIEYIDPCESDCALINIKLPIPDFTELQRKHLTFTHSEIHPVCMLGFMAQLNPASHHSQGTKYVACGGTKHPRQSLGVYHPCFDTRFDTGKIMLAHNPERPIVQNRMTTHTHHDKYGTGNNVIVAISVYDKHNQEDGLTFNKSSIDMGLFHTSYYKTYEAHETLDEKTGMVERFYNPYYRNEVEDYPEELDEHHGSYTFEHLDKYGFVKPGTYLKGHEVLIGKYLKTTNSFGEDTYNDISSHTKPDNIESYVDRVYTSTTNAKGLRMCKLRTCQFRKPENGDKFACYTDKTEVLTEKGWISIDKVTLKDKVAVLHNDNFKFENPTELHNYDFNGKLYDLKSQQVDLTVTPNHRMYIKRRNNKEFEIKTAEECFGKRIRYKKNVNNYKPTNWLGEQFNIPEYIDDNNNLRHSINIKMDEWLIFFGIWIAEGWITNNNIYISVNKSRVKKALYNLLDFNNKFKFNKYNNKEKWIIYDIQLSNYMKEFSVGATNKFLPQWVWRLNKEQSRLLLKSMELGDGLTSNSNCRFYYTSSKKLSDDVSRLCLQAGYSTNIRVYKDRQKGFKSYFNRGNNKIHEVISTEDNYVITIIKNKLEPQINHGYIKTQNGQKEQWIDYKGKVYCLTVSTGVFYVRQNGKPVWCGNSRNGQKGTIGIMLSREDMPFTKDGIVPDIIFNPFGVPTRMTLSQMIEHAMTEIGIDLGFLPQTNIMEKIDIQSIIKHMEERGYNYYGDKILYNGFNGDQMKSLIFMTPVYYQRTYLQTRDKINARAGGQRHNGIPVPGGAYTAKERQVVQGRANGGGIKCGEMERDSLLAHGIMGIINENTMGRGDKFYVYVSPITGEMMVGNPEDKIFFDNSVDGPISFHMKEGTGQGRKHFIGPNTFHKKQSKFVKVQIPYSMKLLLHDIHGCGMTIRLKPETRRLILNKQMAGESIEDMILELNDIVEQENEKMTEYLQQSLVQQLDSEKKIGPLDNTNDVLDDINSELDIQRETKLNELSALNQPENDINNTELRVNLDSSEPQRFSSPLDIPDIGDYTIDGIPTRTSSGQEYTVIKNPQEPLIAINPFNNMKKSIQSEGVDRNDYLFTGMDMPSKYMVGGSLNNNGNNGNNENNENNNGNNGGTSISELYSSTYNDSDSGSGSGIDSINNSEGGYGIEQFSNDDIPDIGLSDLDFNMSGGGNESDMGNFGISNIKSQQITKNQIGGNTNGGDVKQVRFMANEKELSSMGL